MINRAFDKYFVHDNAEIRNEVLGEVDYMNEIARRLSEGVDEAVENYRFGAVNKSGETKYSKSDVDKTSGDDIKYTHGGESNGKLGQTISDEVQGSTFRAGNSEHTSSVDQKEKGRRKVTVSGRTAEILSSSEETAEQKRIKQQLKAEEGQDVYFTTDGTYLVTDSAVFMPADIFEGDGFTLSDRQASFSEDRFNYLVSTYSVKTGGEGSQNYSKGYVTYISPSDFLALTTTNEQHIVEDARNKYYKLDVDVLKNERQTPFLRIDLQTGEVTGHEGRHRMALLRDAGIERVAIVIEADSEAGKYNAQKLTNFKISGQEFNSGKAPGTVVLDEVIPLSPKYRNEVKEKFVDVGSDIKYSVSDIDNYTEEMYDNFGWVKVNDVLSSQALSRMYSQFASINTGVYFDKTPEGYYIIPTGDYNKASNCLVYISGTMEMPVIQKIIKLNLDNETNIYIARMVLDGFERNRSEQSDRARKTCGDLFSDKEIITEYNRKDFESYQELKARTRQSMHASQRNNRAVRDGGRNTSEDSSGSEVVLSDEVKTSISDAGMRLTDNTELSSLMRENADYKTEIERLKGEFVKSKRMGGKGKNRLVQADINRIARSIIGEYSSEISFYDLKDELTGFYEFLANADVESSGDYAFIVKTANDIAKSVIAQSFTDITPEEFADYKKALRGYRLIPNLEDVAELEQMFGTFGAAYRQYGKKLNMRAQGTPGALHIDEVWNELCEAVPLLDRNADSTQEMWRNLIEVRDSLDEKTGFNPYLDGGEFSAGQTAAVLGADILERFNEISPDTTFADRAQQRVDLREQKISELKAEKQEALSKLREQRDARISELKESFREQNRKKGTQKKSRCFSGFFECQRAV